MPIVRGATAPVFTYSMPDVPTANGAPHLSVKGLASPTRGSKETGVWKMTINARTPERMGTVDREEIFVVLTGRAVLYLTDEVEHADTGDVMILPAHTWFGIANPYDEPLELLTVLPVGGHVCPVGIDPCIPPWAE